MIAGARDLGRVTPGQSRLTASRLPLTLVPTGQAIAGLPGSAFFLSRRTRAWPLVQPVPLWEGDGQQGEALLHGHLRFGGEYHSLREVGWYPRQASEGWIARLHSFAWLYDFRATDNALAAETARRLIFAWLVSHRRARPRSFTIEVCARRLLAWLAHLDWLDAPSEAPFMAASLRSLSWQAQWLARAAPWLGVGHERLTAAVALLVLAAALPKSEALSRSGWQLLNRALAQQFLGDGTHASRNPLQHLTLLADLLHLRSVLRQTGSRGLEAPAWLDPLIERMASVAKLWILPDSRLAPFQEQTPSLFRTNASAILERAGATWLAAAEQLVEGGYQRIKARRTTLIVESAALPAPGFDRHHHAGALSFVLSIGQQGIVTNCGTFVQSAEWHQAGRLTSAHSTLIWRDLDSCRFDPKGGIRDGAAFVSATRQEGEGFTRLELLHDGYASLGGGTHYRRLRLHQSGELLEGEDRLEGAQSPLPYLRFHLVPGVSAEMTMNRRSVILRLPTRERGWRFEVREALVQIAETAIANAQGRPGKSQQIVVSADPAQFTGRLSWAFVQEGSPVKPFSLA